MSFRSHDVRSHPWVGRLGGDHFGNKQGMKINESAEYIVILSVLQVSCIGFRITNQFRTCDIGFKGFNVNCL